MNTSNSLSDLYKVGLYTRAMEFKDRLQQLLEAKDGGNMSALAAFCKITPQAVQQWIAQGRTPRTHRLKEVAAYFGLTEQELLFGESVPTSMKERSEERPVVPASGIPVQAYDEGNAEFVPIRAMRLKLSAGISGYGAEPDLTVKSAPIVFQREWMEKNGLFPEDLIALKIRGDSMDPSLRDGDLVVINVADKVPKDGMVYAVNYDGEDVVKRMEYQNREWWLVSDNPDQQRYSRKICRGASCIVIGQVIYKQSRII